VVNAPVVDAPETAPLEEEAHARVAACDTAVDRRLTDRDSD